MSDKKKQRVQMPYLQRFLKLLLAELLLRKKETYIYCHIGTKLLTSLSGDPLNAHI
jgi:hypothetical protein